MRKVFLLAFCISFSCISFCQQKETRELSKLFDTDITEMYKQRLDSLGKEVENLQKELKLAGWRVSDVYKELNKANDNTSTVVRLFSLLNKIETKQITKQDSSFYVNPNFVNNIDTTGPIIIEYYDGVQDYLPPWDSLLKAFPYVEKLYKTDKLKFESVSNEVASSHAPEIVLPPMPAFSKSTFSLPDKQKLADEWIKYLSQVVDLCKCPQAEYERYSNIMIVKREKAKAEFKKKNQRNMNRAELLDNEIELTQKCAFLLEKKFCKK